MTTTYNKLLSTKCMTGVFAGSDASTHSTKKEVLKDIADKIDELKEGGFSGNANQEAFRQITQEYALARKYEVAVKLKQSDSVNKAMNFLRGTGETDLSLPLKAMINGLTAKERDYGRKHALTYKMEAIYDDRMGRMYDAMDKDDVLKHYDDHKWMSENEGEFAEEIANPQSSKNEAIRKLGKHINSLYQEVRNDGYEALIPKKLLDDFIGSMRYNVQNILSPTGSVTGDLAWKAANPFTDSRPVALSRFKKEITSSLDAKRSFPLIWNDPVKMNDVLEKEFSHITLDTVTESKNKKNDVAMGGSKRINHYKDGYETTRINKIYGSGDLRSMIEQTVKGASKMETLARDMSPDVYGTYGKIKDEINKDILKQPTQKQAKLTKNLNSIDKYFNEVTGVASTPASAAGARAADATLNAINITTKAGSIFWTPMDWSGVVTAQTLRGVNPVKSLLRAPAFAIGRLLRVNTHESVTDALGKWSRVWTGHASSHYAASGGSVGKVGHSAMNAMYKRTGVLANDRALRDSTMDFMTRDLFSYKGKRFDRLSKAQKTVLGQYLTSDEWDVVRKYHAQDKDGTKRITPDEYLEYTKADISKLVGLKPEEISDNLLKKTQIGLRRSIIGMLDDQASFVYQGDNTTVNALLRVGQKPGTRAGMAARIFVSGFSWTGGNVNTILARQFARFMQPGMRGSAFTTSMSYIAAIYATKYVSTSLQNLVKGEKPPDPFSQKFAIEAGTESAALMGRAAEAIIKARDLGEFTHNIEGQGFKRTSDVISISHKIFTGKPFGSKLYDLVANNMPVANWPVIKTAMDLTVNSYIHSMIDPDYAQKQEDIADKYGEEYFGPLKPENRLRAE